jgi:hypothetical protein
VKEKSDKENFPPLFRVDLPAFFASALTLVFFGVFWVLTKVFFCMAGSSRVFALARFRAILSQEACQTRIDSTGVLDPLKNKSLTHKIQRILNVWANDYPNGYLTALIDTRQVVD